MDAAQWPWPLHRAELSREVAACMALELGDKLQGTPKVQIMVQRVPPGFPHHMRLEASNFPGKASNISERLPSQMSNAACHQAPSLYLIACCNSIALWICAWARAVCLAGTAAASIAGALCIRQGINHKQQGDSAALDCGTSQLASDSKARTTAGRQCSSHGRRMRATTATAAAATGAARRTRREPICATAAPAAAPLLEAAATEPRPGLRLLRADRLPPPAAPPVRLLPCVSSPPSGLAASWLQAAAARGVSDACAIQWRQI